MNMNGTNGMSGGGGAHHTMAPTTGAMNGMGGMGGMHHSTAAPGMHHGMDMKKNESMMMVSLYSHLISFLINPI